ncbi:MAG: hypothetical protein COW67_01445 [Flavobacteriales bacterium CG18_big_fil_WC_8_21_14_2_50_32_9]|nr:MAG: hypothetical protein COW67_01445 [Flavobacteriales bacterium CG18_big_fil_WC_8_21_14_2_50_32_9]
MKKIYLLLGLISLISIQLVAQCNSRYQTNIFTNVDVTTVQYGSNMDLNNANIDLYMDIYQPQGDVETNRPLVIFAHGGSFSGGSRNSPEIVFIATELAKKGYVCASISYRLAPSAFSLIAEETTIKVVFMAIQDGKAAIRFFKQDAANANTYKINPDQIFMGGTSAGGILAYNLAYGDTITKLSSQWQTWVNQVGGIEGNSGNSGYCSRVNGTFGFAGGVADTVWINDNDVPLYATHSYDDQTVKFGYGKPLNGFTPVFLYGSGPINIRMDNINTYNELDDYAGSDHPPFANSTPILNTTNDNLTTFLFNILDCNPSNLKKPNQKDCSTFTIGIAENKLTSTFSAYPNPAEDFITIDLSENPTEIVKISVINSVGQLVISEQTQNRFHKLDLLHLPKGAYVVHVIGSKNYTNKLIIKK